MALSSSESALLAQTCENMNIAANTCHEVLEMLRNLGNTGVVDIATHNSTPGAHATDYTLIHLSPYLTGKEFIIGDKDGLDFWPVWYRCSSKEASIYNRTKTYGGSMDADTNMFFRTFTNLTDSSGNYVTEETDTSVTSLHSMYYERHDFVISGNTKSLTGFIHDSGAITPDGVQNGKSGWSCIRPMASSPSIENFTVPFEFSVLGITPINNNYVSLGLSGYAWKDLFLVNQPTVTSDRRAKQDISALGSQAVDFVMALRPVSYRLREAEGQPEEYNDKMERIVHTAPGREGIRTHWGLIAQEVREALSTAGIEDAALWCLADKNDPDSQQSLRYAEIIAPMIAVIQNQQVRIEALERKVA